MRFAPLFMLLILSFVFACRSKNSVASHHLVLHNWVIQSADSVHADGAQISTDDYHPENWWPARVPTTVMGALLKDGQYPNLFVGMNLKYVSEQPFTSAWWFRSTFDLPDLSERPQTLLRFNGINYRADVFLNGHKIASADTLFGAFRVFELNITPWVQARNNVLAVRVFPPRPGDFSIGFVDWNPPPPDRNMGLWRPVEIYRVKNLLLKNAFVKTRLSSGGKSAHLTVRVTVKNLTADSLNGTLKGSIEEHRFATRFHLKPFEKTVIVFDPEKFPQLIFKHPRLWWPLHFGRPFLYRLHLKAEVREKDVDQIEMPFGMREVQNYFTGEGYRGFKINGRRILIQGAGWTDNLFLNNSGQNIRAQLRYVQHIGLNTIRLEGFWGNDQTLYNLCDSLGILIMAGFSCHWEWTSYLGKACDRFGGARSEEDMNLLAAYWKDQITALRNHPSVFVYLGGSDMLPRPELEKRYLRILRKMDGTRPYLGAAAAARSEVSGSTGVKMNGPYDYVPPKYWYEDTSHGGAFGFNTETGPGPQPPPLYSIKKMIPPDHLWPVDTVWDFHCGRNEFHTLKRYRKALDNRYGTPPDLTDFVRKAQVTNYEAMRAMFEAFAVRKFKATGVIQWMLNSAWPELYWQLYDYYLMPNGAFYGARKACRSLQLIYDYKKRDIYLNNNSLQPAESLFVSMRLYDLYSNLAAMRDTIIDIDANSVKRVFAVEPSFAKTPVYFLDLRLKSIDGKLKSTNFYWLPKKDDVLDYDHSTWYVTPIKYFADLTALNRLPQAKIKVNVSASSQNNKLLVRLKNVSTKLAFFIYLELQDKNGQPVLPVFWDDNYISLLPNESRDVQVAFRHSRPVQVKISGWNLKETQIIHSKNGVAE